MERPRRGMAGPRPRWWAGLGGCPNAGPTSYPFIAFTNEGVTLHPTVSHIVRWPRRLPLPGVLEGAPLKIRDEELRRLARHVADARGPRPFKLGL